MKPTQEDLSQRLCLGEAYNTSSYSMDSIDAREDQAGLCKD